MRSPSRAPPVKGLVGSTATTATRWPLWRYAVISRSTSVDLPAPGGPVMPIRRARPTDRWTCASSCSKPGRPFSTTEIARASAAVLPAWRPASRRSGSIRERSPEGGIEASAPRPQVPAARLVRVCFLIAVLDVELFLGGPIDDEHQHHAHHEGPQQPQLNPANLAQQQRGAAAHEIPQPGEDQRPDRRADAVHQEELGERQVVQTPEEHTRRLGAIDETRREELPGSEPLGERLDSMPDPAIEPPRPEPRTPNSAERVPGEIADQAADRAGADGERKREVAEVGGDAREDKGEVALECGADQHGGQTVP